MTAQLWRDTTVKALATEIGAQANKIVDEAVAECGVPEHQMTPAHFVELVRVLYEKLPPTVDRRALCRSVTASILQAYGFPSGSR